MSSLLFTSSASSTWSPLSVAVSTFSKLSLSRCLSTKVGSNLMKSAKGHHSKLLHFCFGQGGGGGLGIYNCYLFISSPGLGIWAKMGAVFLGEEGIKVTKKILTLHLFFF